MCLPSPLKQLYAFVTFNLLTCAFVSGQMLTVGKGTLEIGTGFSVNPIYTGFSFQFCKMYRIDEPQKHTDRLKAIIHHNLCGILGISKNRNEKIRQNVYKCLSRMRIMSLSALTFRCSVVFVLQSIESHESYYSNKTRWKSFEHSSEKCVIFMKLKFSFSIRK